MPSDKAPPWAETEASGGSGIGYGNTFPLCCAKRDPAIVWSGDKALCVDKKPLSCQISSLQTCKITPSRLDATVLQGRFVLDLVPAILSAFRVFFRSRLATSLEVLALRQQVAVLKRKRPQSPLNGLDHFFGPPFGACGRNGRMFWLS